MQQLLATQPDQPSQPDQSDQPDLASKMSPDPASKMSVDALCAVFEVSRSGYYAHLHKATGARRQQDQELGKQMEAVFHESRDTYGSPRLAAVLRRSGVRCGKNRLCRLMHERGLVAKQKQRRNPRTTDSRHTLPVAPNLLGAAPPPTAINQQWCADITYIPTQEGWLYTAGTLDCYSRRLVGWQTAASLEQSVVLDAAGRALEQRRPPPGLIHHTDRGGQYAGHQCQALLAAHEAQPSMSRAGNCYDNAMMESFWATLKTECFGDYIPATRAEAHGMLFDYIEVFYNRVRAHSALGYLSPLQFEQQQVRKA